MIDYTQIAKPYHFQHLVIVAHVAGEYTREAVYGITAANINGKVAEVVANPKYDRAHIVNNIVHATSTAHLTQIK